MPRSRDSARLLLQVLFEIVSGASLQRVLVLCRDYNLRSTDLCRSPMGKASPVLLNEVQRNDLMTAGGTSTTLDDTTIAQFRSALRGDLMAADHAGYESARQVWNGNIDRRPGLIARCAGVADVQQAVTFARTHLLRLSIRGGGHSAPGYGTNDGGLVIDMAAMKGIRVDPVARTARAQGGVIWRELDHETQAFGLATTGGTVSNTGVVGLTLGGGLGWLMGKHGLAVDNLISADIVTADGQFRTASATEHPDLFWALRGGGGNFGVVTSAEYRVHEVSQVLGGLVLFPLDQARDVLLFYREFCGTLPDEAEAYLALLTAPQGMPVVALILGYNGPIAEGEKVLAPARRFGKPIADLVGPLPYGARRRCWTTRTPRTVCSGTGVRLSPNKFRTTWFTCWWTALRDSVRR